MSPQERSQACRERRAAIVEDVEFLLSPWGGREHPEVIAQRLGMSLSALDKSLRVAGRPDLALPFSRASTAMHRRTA